MIKFKRVDVVHSLSSGGPDVALLRHQQRRLLNTKSGEATVLN